jgi:hypothetical protein
MTRTLLILLPFWFAGILIIVALNNVAKMPLLFDAAMGFVWGGWFDRLYSRISSRRGGA